MKEPAIRLGVYWQSGLLAIIYCDDCDDLITWRDLLAPFGFGMLVRGNARLPMVLLED